MTVYLFTLAFFLFFCGVAEYADSSRIKVLQSGRVLHTREAGYFYFIVAVILICVSGLRYKVGTDYGAYYSNYTEYASRLADALKTLDEPGYPFIAWITTKVYNDGAFAVFLASLITIGPPMLVIYHFSKELTMPVALFVFLGFWHGSFNGVRQHLAAAIVFCGYRFLKKGKIIPYFAVVFIAALFHRSAIICVLLLIVVHQRVNYRNIIITAIATFFLLRAYDRIFDVANWVMDANYSMENQYTSTAVNILRVIVSSSPMVLFLGFYLNRLKSKEEEFYLNLIILHAVVRIVTMNSALLYRVGVYTTAFQTIAIPRLLEKIPERERGVIKTGMMVLYAVYWLYEIQHSSSLNHFRWIWQR